MARKLTPQFLLTKLKRRLGIKSLNLSYSDEELLDILYDESIPTFSIYFPAVVPMKFDLSYCQKANYVTSSPLQKAYKLPIPDNINVIDIQDIDFYSNTIGNYYSPNSLDFQDSFSMFYGEMEQGMMESMMSTPITKRFIEPDILVIDEPSYMCSRAVRIKFLTEHARDFSTINFSYLDWITQLFVLDCKIFLYEDMKHHDKIDTTFQQIDLKIDDWSDAKSEKEQLLEKWDRVFLNHREKTIYRI